MTYRTGLVALVYDGGGRSTAENRALIAAAPEMAEILRTLAAVDMDVRVPADVRVDVLRRYRDDARALLARLDGESA